MIYRIHIICILLLCGILPAQDGGGGDPGRDQIAQVEVTVYHATNADPAAAGAVGRPATADEVRRLSADESMRFEHYQRLGQDQQPLLRSYESWAEPLRPSDEVLLRFEAQGRADDISAVLDLELWLARKKILKLDARLDAEKPLYVLGPNWRDGRLIIAIQLVESKAADS
ncbi:MAG: hypothetical protein ACO3RV_02935 [Luteolibacter sp.]